MAAQKPTEKPEQKPDGRGDDQPAPGAVKPDAAALEAEKPDYSALEAIADEGGAGSANDDYRPGPESPAKPATDTVGARELATLFQMVYGVAAVRLGKHWTISDTEATDLGRATDAVLRKYGASVAMGPEFTLVMTAAVVTAPRVMLTLGQRHRKPDQKPDPEREGGQLEAGDGGQ